MSADLGLTRADLDRLVGARCYDTDVDPELWFPVAPPGRNAAGRDWDTPRTECRACPVLHECALWAMSEPDPTNGFGMYGGLTPAERDRLRRDTAPKPSHARRLLLEPTAHPSCGRYPGYKRHKADGEFACEPCLVAKATYEQKRRRVRRRATLEESA